MNDQGHHAEWLNLIDVSGPFLAEPVLKDAFPQGLEGLDAAKKRSARQAYDEWREALDLDDPELPKIHWAWIELVLKQVLELDENDSGDILKSAANLPEILRHDIPERGVSLLPHYAVLDSRADGRALLLIVSYDANISLTESLGNGGWVASPAERMVELCRGTGVRLGLVTNGEQWMLVDAPVGAVTSFASWYARHWSQEPITLQAFVNLLGVRRFFVDSSQQLPALLDNSLKFQDEVTDALGEQVARAVEVLIQALDRADIDRDRELLDGIEPRELYEAGLTVMMRIVFLLSAEERGLLLLGDERYESGYAVSTLRMQLRSETEEILERRWDAWSRLLSIFRAVFAGVDHEAMRLPALGGSLFDPDRFPFLEGRKRGTRWKNDLAMPLPIDNRTVLYLLDAVQVFQGRTLSYLALDIEQIGYVYEGLLERTVVRAKEVTLDLDATRNAKNPWVSLPELDDAAANGRHALEALLKERTGSSATRVRNELNRLVEEGDADRLLTACHADLALRNRVRPYFHLLRTDRWGYPIVYPKGAFMVATGTDRRETGTHYTPKSFTEAIVKETLEPLVYEGPAEGLPRERWKLKSPAALLDLKVCDPAMGSGAFLVQVCRWLADRLVEAWSLGEENGVFVAADGEVVDEIGSREPLRKDAEERVLTARRLIAERCLYGVDINPLAVELAKLSIWLITLAKGRPFGFLDHNFRCGDSLLGITDVEQLNYLEMKPGQGSAKKLFASAIDQAISEAIELRTQLRNRLIRDIRDVEVMARLDEEARYKLALSELIADAFISEVFAASGKEPRTDGLAIDIGDAISGDKSKIETLSRHAQEGLCKDLPASKRDRRPFHWPLEFPEVFRRENDGFDAIVGNPPFAFGKNVSVTLGTTYNAFLVTANPAATKNVDLCAHFFHRAFVLLGTTGTQGMLATSSIAEGETRLAGLENLLSAGASIYSATSKMRWPGSANVFVCRVSLSKRKWHGFFFLDGKKVDGISSFLTSETYWQSLPLRNNKGIAFYGAIPNGDGFFLSKTEAEAILLNSPDHESVLYPFLTGKDLNSSPDQSASRYAINFWDWAEADAAKYEQAYKIVVERVKPYRQTLLKTKPKLATKWWLYEANPKGLHEAIGRNKYFRGGDKRPVLDEVIVIARVSSTNAFVFVPTGQVFDCQLIVIASNDYGLFAVLQSHIHFAYAWHHGGKMKSDLRYSPTMCLATFPFPNRQQMESLRSIGKTFNEKRQFLLRDRGWGLTRLANSLNDPGLNDLGVQGIRSCLSDMDQQVLESYGWGDIDLAHGFHHVAYLPEGRNPRYTICEAARLEMLRRLSKLNKEQFGQQNRAESELPSDVAIAASNANNDLFAEGDIST